MPISSRSLFQFTSKLQTLEDILVSGFLWPRYCTEYYWGKYRFALPMVCLCDIPLSDITTHIEHYGNYGIGISRDWAEKIPELSTVLYTRLESALGKKVVNILKKKYDGEDLTPNEVFLLSRIKKYSGNTFCSPCGKRKEIRNVRFYNEREWRFVPPSLSNDDIIVEISQDKKAISGDNEKTKGEPKYDISDIRYLIVKDDSDAIKMADFIDGELTKKKKLSKANNVLLKSRIISVKQIKEDF